jgi:hypothetical protein
MKEVYKNLFVGSQFDYECNPKMFDDWFVVHACKEPYHRKALGYTGRSAPKDDPRYLFLYDEKHHLILNMVDTDSPEFFRYEMINEAIFYVIEGLKKGKRVLIHCNQGESRAPSLAVLALRKIGVFKGSFSESIVLFRNIYPNYNPKSGIYNYVQFNW